MDRFWDDDDQDQYEDGDYWSIDELTNVQLLYCGVMAALAGLFGSILWQVGVGGWFWSFLKYVVPKF